jgi:hypothetical protein
MSGDEPRHDLFLISGQTGKKVPLYTYGRSVEVFWCPSSHCVVINDFEGSNVSNVLLLNIQGPAPNVIDLGEILTRWMENHQSADIVSSCDHVYAYARKISGNGNIRLVLTGYNGINPKGFSRTFIYEPDGRLTLVRTSSRFTGAGN